MSYQYRVRVKPGIITGQLIIKMSLFGHKITIITKEKDIS